ncbi:hypothetical protein [Bacillus salacetis]|uniref:hypothetical protein n=1 Tax=Bacillus salacetis TaxID=2315464 RepID=UPI0014447DDA|nr:hypothetical protein [Bacillus salacetis]
MKNSTVQPCQQCGQRLSIESFYHKGNILMHCSSCRAEKRQTKKREMMRLLGREQRLS